MHGCCIELLGYLYAPRFRRQRNIEFDVWIQCEKIGQSKWRKQCGDGDGLCREANSDNDGFDDCDAEDVSGRRSLHGRRRRVVGEWKG